MILVADGGQRPAQRFSGQIDGMVYRQVDNENMQHLVWQQPLVWHEPPTFQWTFLSN